MTALSPMSRFAADFPSHDVSVNELFFSMTDGRGVIRQVNDVFVRLSRHGREDLIGAPHNIIRHPDMPAGLFRIMWRTLQEGRPFAGYIRNRARGDSTYDTLATVTPLPDGGYLSVRIPPLTEHFATAREVYHAMNDLEHGAREEGLDRRGSAERGAECLVAELAARGFDSYEQLQWEILPAEVEELERHRAGQPGAGSASGAHAELLATVHDLHEALDGFVAARRRTVETTSALASAGRRLDEETTATVRVGTEMDRLDITGPERTLLLAPLQVWTTMHGIVTDHIGELTDLLTELRRVGARTRFHIALARLHTTMTAGFAGDLPEEVPAGDPATAAIPPLVDALRTGVAEMADRVAEHERLSNRVNLKVRSVISIMGIPQDVIAGWLADTSFEQFPQDVRQLVDEVRSAAAGTAGSIRELETLTARLTGEAGLAPERLRTHVERVSRAATAYLG